MGYQDNREIVDFIQWLPKTETHLHIEGALPFHLLQELDPAQYPSTPAGWGLDFKFATFKHFEDELLGMVNAWYISPERYHLAAKEIFPALVEQNVKYLEISFHAGMIELHDLDGREVVEAIKSAAPEGFQVRVFMGMLRDHYNEKMAPILDDCPNWEGLDGIDLHGPERLPILPWKERLWRAAREAGLETKAHAGEFGGADYVREAIELLGVKRVQHGIRAIEDAEVVQMAVDQGVTFDVCPISNVKLDVVETMEAHPIRQLFDQGVRCTISTDDPLSFGNRLIDEYEALSVDLFSKVELAQLARNGFEVAVMDAGEKDIYLAQIDSFLEDN